MPLQIAQFTDIHLFADKREAVKGVQTWHSFQKVLDHFKHLPQTPDLLLLTGDLSQDETTESYCLLRDALAPLHIPTYWIPGNHDRSDLLASILGDAPFSTEKQIQIGEWQILLLDSVIPGAVQGRLSDATLDWIEDHLTRNPAMPTLIALHHPPLAVESAWMDAIGLENSAEFRALIHRHPQVKAVICGHVHQEFDEQRQRIRYLATPSTCVQFKPKSDVFMIDGDRPPGFRLLDLHPDGSLETWVKRIPQI